MNWSALDRLLDKYYSGDTTPGEVEQLLEYLGQPGLPGQYEEDRLLLQSLYGDEAAPEPSPDFNKRILNAIDDYEAEKKLSRAKRQLYAVVSAAASVLIIISIWFTVGRGSSFEDTYSDPQLAYNETVEILYTVSANLNRGREEMGNLDALVTTKERLQKVPEAGNVIKDDLEQLKYLGKSMKMLGITDKDNNK
ncbi:MAG TPA: hypothetical protein VJ877_03385 [Bacteroidales bacterium]|nr:hypothetical protein [Bacteroidales bacterium]